MVRSKFTCQSGLDAFKQEFKEISKQNNPNDVLKEWFVKIYIQEDFTNKIPAADQQTWFKKNKKSTSSSISEALVEGTIYTIFKLFIINGEFHPDLPITYLKNEARDCVWKVSVLAELQPGLKLQPGLNYPGWQIPYNCTKIFQSGLKRRLTHVRRCKLAKQQRLPTKFLPGFTLDFSFSPGWNIPI